MPLRLYLSHASEDQARVNQLRDELKANDFEVFLCEDLPAGSDWQKEIDRALKQTDVFIYCLSAASVARLGKYNDELKAARVRYRMEGEQAILIVPLRLEPCSIPSEVQDLMALDLFPPDGLNRFLELLRSRTQAAARYVFLLHGIKTRGKWEKDVSPLLSARGLIPVPLDFGNFGARHLVWRPSRKKKRQWLLAEYSMQCDRLQCQSPSIVAHSFGCYLVASLLKKYSQVRFDRIIFCGSIVHPAYPWASLAANGQVKSVLNQYGGEDFWAWVVQWGVEDAGPSGYSGFTKPAAVVHQQNHPEFEHSDYFYDLNYNQNWIPFLLGNPLPSPAVSPGDCQSHVNWRFRILAPAIGALLLCGLAAALSIGWRHFRRSPLNPSAQTSVKASAPQPFSGFVQDDRGAPLPGVTVTAPMINVPPQKTDRNGRFSFQVDLPAGTNFRVIFEKPGFQTKTADPPAGDATFNTALHKVSRKESP
jgi:pimeloyl-ACP methyl ester carboxylesterase